MASSTDEEELLSVLVAEAASDLPSLPSSEPPRSEVMTSAVEVTVVVVVDDVLSKKKYLLSHHDLIDSIDLPVAVVEAAVVVAVVVDAVVMGTGAKLAELFLLTTKLVPRP